MFSKADHVKLRKNNFNSTGLRTPAACFSFFLPTPLRFKFALFFTLLISLLGVGSLFSQSKGEEVLQKKLSYTCQQKTTPAILIELSQLAKVSIGFDAQVLDEKKRDYSFQEKSLSDILGAVLSIHNFGFVFINDGILLEPKARISNYTISGFVEDAENGEPLISATIFHQESGKGAVTNEFGFFSLEIPAGKVVLEVSYLGYEKTLYPLTLSENLSVRSSLKPSLSFEPVEIIDSSSSVLRRQLPFSNSLQMSAETLNSSPSLGGEPDLFRYLQQQPGITTGTDGLGGLHVRGGNVDQNLIMLDGIPIFNPSHALGLFSIFNASIVNSATLYRSGFSARYGGNVSSVLDVRSKEGNIKKFTAEFDISTVASKASLEVPFKEEKGGFLLALRRTHLDPIIKVQSENVKAKNNILGHSNFNFYDINAKVNFKAGKNDRFYFSFYRGADDYNDHSVRDVDFGIDDTTGLVYAQEDQHIDWNNSIGSFRWNHLFGDKLFSNVTATLSRFNYQSYNAYLSDRIVGGSIELFDFYNRFYSNIIDLRIKADFDYFFNSNHKFIWGGEILSRTFEPGSIGEDTRLVFDPGTEIDFDSIISDTFSYEIFDVLEGSVYVEDQMKIGDYLSLNVGLRNTFFIGTDRNYNSLQPRINIKYKPSRRFGVELGASKMSQFLHLVTAADAGLPNDLWVPSTEIIKPQHAWETSLSFGYEFSKSFRVSTAGYYKKLQNVLAYAQDASLPTLMDNDPGFWEEAVEQGSGLAYGWESQIQCALKNQQLNVNYTWSNSERSFENLNNGFAFPSRYDLRHVLQINYYNKLSKNWELQLAWNYSSGQPISLIRVADEFSPLSSLGASDTELVGTINEYRLSDYHRLDGSFKWNSTNRKHQITLGAYNIYNQNNSIYAYQVANEMSNVDDGIRFRQGLGIIPTIGYHWQIR